MSDPFQTAPDGYTRTGMSKGWLRPVRAPGVKRIMEENKQLKQTLASVMDRLDKLEKEDES